MLGNSDGLKLIFIPVDNFYLCKSDAYDVIYDANDVVR